MLPGQNSNSYSTQGWLAQIYELLESGVVGGNMQNGSIINGTAFFVTDTKPTTRIGGGALVAGDKWYKTDDGTEWFWNGTYWLSQDYITYPNTTGAFNLSSGFSVQYAYFPIKNGQTFLKGIRIEADTTVPPVDSSNYFSTAFYFARNDSFRGSPIIASYDINTTSVSLTLTTNLVVPVLAAYSGSPLVGIRCETTSVGSVGGVRFLYFPIFNYIYL